jgi:hypothetical protein
MNTAVLNLKNKTLQWDSQHTNNQNLSVSMVLSWMTFVLLLNTCINGVIMYYFKVKLSLGVFKYQPPIYSSCMPQYWHYKFSIVRCSYGNVTVTDYQSIAVLFFFGFFYKSIHSFDQAFSWGSYIGRKQKSKKTFAYVCYNSSCRFLLTSKHILVPNGVCV